MFQNLLTSSSGEPGDEDDPSDARRVGVDTGGSGGMTVPAAGTLSCILARGSELLFSVLLEGSPASG